MVTGEAIGLPPLPFEACDSRDIKQLAYPTPSSRGVTINRTDG
jgi:hypothetical protein